MTPQDLISLLVQKTEEQGRQYIQSYVAQLHGSDLDEFVYLLKKEGDRLWAKDASASLKLSGHLMLIGELKKTPYYHALGLMARGDALRRLDRDADALPFFDAAGEEFLEIGDEEAWARTRFGRISACLFLNRTTEALQDAAKAHDIFIRYGKLTRAAQIDVNAAVINFELGQYEQAIRLFDRAIDTYVLHGQGVDLHIARARANKALTLAAMGLFREAVVLHEQARSTFLAYGEREEIAVARQDMNIADIYATQGHYSQALLLYRQSRTLFQKHTLLVQASEVAQQICACLLRLNRVQEAYTLADETIHFFRTSPAQRHNLARSLMHLAAAATLEGDVRGAEQMLREASILLEEGGFVRLASLARLRRAELYFTDKQYEASLRETQYVSDAFSRQDDLPNFARATLLRARLADVMHDAEAAYDYCIVARNTARDQGLLDLKYLCDDLLGQLAEQSGDLDEASYHYEAAVQGIDEVQSRLVLDERASFLEDKAGIYQHAMALALKRGNVDQSLIYVEKAKSRVLGDYLRNNIDIRLRAGDRAGEAILEDLTRLREEQAWFSAIVYERDNEANMGDTTMMYIRSASPGQARIDMQDREQKIEHLLEQMQLRSAGDLVARPQPQWTDSIVTSLWPRLASTTLMLEYYLSEQDIYIFQLTRKGVDVQVVQGAVPKLERLLSLWRANLDLASQAAGTDDRASAFLGLQENSLGLLQRLYDLLLRPVSHVLENFTHLIIVPYGPLHYLPFHSLFDGVQFVVERFGVSYLPAAALLDICRQRGQRIATSGVPVHNALVLGLSDNGKLPYAVQEAEAVARLVGTHPALNEQAKTTLLQEYGEFSPLVHIAAHGLFRLDAPNFSHVKLADGQLSAIDVFNLNFSSCSLVTLSACETGRAVVSGIDEVIGLGRGFLYAGAASLMPTLWKVDDASSAELMEMFYQSLLSGNAKVTALAQSQRAFLARARTSVRPYRVHPYFWAGFHLIGDYGVLFTAK